MSSKDESVKVHWAISGKRHSGGCRHEFFDESVAVGISRLRGYLIKLEKAKDQAEAKA